MKLFVSQNTDVALNLHQEFMRIRTNREYDRLAIVAGIVLFSFQLIFRVKILLSVKMVVICHNFIMFAYKCNLYVH